MAKACGGCAATVSRIWRVFAMKPHRYETFKLSRDSQFIDKVRNIVGLYLHPPVRAVVLCVDEKRRFKPLTACIRCCQRPGLPERRTHDYRRHATTSPFAALNCDRNGRRELSGLRSRPVGKSVFGSSGHVEVLASISSSGCDGRGSGQRRQA